MKIYGCTLKTTYAVTLLRITNGHFVLADTYATPDAPARTGFVINASANANIGINRNDLSIGKTVTDNSETNVSFAIKTDQPLVSGSFTFPAVPRATAGTAILTIGKQASGQNIPFETTAELSDDDVAFSLNVDPSWGRDANGQE